MYVDQGGKTVAICRQIPLDPLRAMQVGVVVDIVDMPWS